LGAILPFPARERVGSAILPTGGEKLDSCLHIQNCVGSNPLPPQLWEEILALSEEGAGIPFPQAGWGIRALSPLFGRGGGGPLLAREGSIPPFVARGSGSAPFVYKARTSPPTTSQGWGLPLYTQGGWPGPCKIRGLCAPSSPYPWVEWGWVRPLLSAPSTDGGRKVGVRFLSARN